MRGMLTMIDPCEIAGRHVGDCPFGMSDVARDSRLDHVAEAIVRALTDAGGNPAYHYATMDRHRQEWPTLWVSLDHLVRTMDERP